MIEHLNMATWPVWAQIPGAIIGVIAWWKLLTVLYWGPAT